MFSSPLGSILRMHLPGNGRHCHETVRHGSRHGSEAYRGRAGKVRNVSLLVAIGVTSEGYREMLGICEGSKEYKSGRAAFLRHLVDRGLNGVELVTSDACSGLIEENVGQTLTCCAFLDSHWIKLGTNNPLERVMREIRRRTRVIGAFPDGQSRLNLAAARLRLIAGTQWSTRRYMNMDPPHAAKNDQTRAAVA